jgi:hypothetical protein
MTAFVTYWDGAPFTHYEHLCINSFLDRGHSMEVASYGTLRNLPAGVRLLDAREFLPLDGLVQGLLDSSHYSKVSDILRYRLLADGTRTWVDVDVVLLKDDLPPGPSLFGMEDQHHANTAILRLDPHSALTARLIDETSGLDLEHVRGLPHGALSPVLLTRLVDELGLRANALARGVLYPIASRDLWRLFDPREREWCERAIADASTLHLWNEFLRRARLKERRPPRGSWLDRAMKDRGVASTGSVASLGWIRGPWRQQLPEPPPLSRCADLLARGRRVAGRLRRLLPRLLGR